MHAVLLGLLFVVGSACSGPPGIPHDEIPVEVSIVALDVNHSPVVVLEEIDGGRRLPIWIGIAEARSIAAEMEEFEAPRPNTHDLAKRVIQRLDGELIRAVVTELRDGTYYAILFLRVGGNIVEVDSRPSDAIAIALRSGAPIFVWEPLFESAARGSDEKEPGYPI